MLWHLLNSESLIVESTATPPDGRYHPALVWVHDSGVGASVGWRYDKATGQFAPPAPERADFSNLQAMLVQSINNIYQTRMSAIANGYPLHERESWPVQLEEANALQTDHDAATPWLDACAGARGLDKTELARRVLEKDAAYRVISGNLSGTRQRHEDAIALLETVEQAQAYDVNAWWPE